MNEATAALVVPQLTGLSEFCRLLATKREQAESVLGCWAIPASLPHVPAGGVVAIRDVDGQGRRQLRAAGFHLFPEAGNREDAHRGTGWPEPLRVDEDGTQRLDSVALVQVLPDWDHETTERLLTTLEDGRQLR